jgi:hypothetical protein
LTRKRARKKERKKVGRKLKSRESGQVRQQTNATFNNSHPKKEKKRKGKKKKKRKEEAERKQGPKLHDGCFWVAGWPGHESRLTYRG